MFVCRDPYNGRALGSKKCSRGCLLLFDPTVDAITAIIPITWVNMAAVSRDGEGACSCRGELFVLLSSRPFCVRSPSSSQQLFVYCSSTKKTKKTITHPAGTPHCKRSYHQHFALPWRAVRGVYSVKGGKEVYCWTPAYRCDKMLLC